MGHARLNKGTKKRVITSVERQIVCFSVGSPLQRHFPTTKWAVHPNSSAKLRSPETKTKPNRKNFSSHQNSFEPYANTSRRLAPKTRLLSRKNRDLLDKTRLLYSPTPLRPHFLLAPTLFCPSTRAYAHSANFRFLPSPFTTRDISLILGELGVKAMPSNAFTRLKSFLLTRRGRKNTVNEGLVFHFWLPSPLPSPSTPCISIRCRALTLYFEVKEIKRTFTLFGHLSH